MAEKLYGMQIITFDYVEPQKRGRGIALIETGLEVNMHSNYISARFNYEARGEARKRNRQKWTETH